MVDADIRKARLIDVWSDGCSGQFKSRYALRLYYELAKRTGIQFRVNFLAPGHGHTLADSCAGKLKEQANYLLLGTYILLAMLFRSVIELLICLGREGRRACGALFSVASPSLRSYRSRIRVHMRHTNVTLLGRIDRNDSLRPKQHALDGIK